MKLNEEQRKLVEDNIGIIYKIIKLIVDFYIKIWYNITIYNN